MGRMKKCPRCGQLIYPHEAVCAECFIDNLNNIKAKKVIENII